MVLFMDVIVRTGRTKVQRGTTLDARFLEGGGEEKLCFLIQAQGKSEDVKKLEEECIHILEQSVLEGEGELVQRFDGALKEMNGLLRGVGLSEGVEDLHLLVAVFREDGVLHISHAGRAEAYVVRGGSASQITEYAKGKPLPAFAHIASGSIEARDTVVLSTQRLLRTLTAAQLVKLAQREDELLDELKGVLDTEEEQAALITIRVAPSSTSLPSPSVSPVKREGRRRGRPVRALSLPLFACCMERVWGFFGYVRSTVRSLGDVSLKGEWYQQCLHVLFPGEERPQRGYRLHLLVLASALTVFLIVWATVQVSTTSQHGKLRAELSVLIEQIDGEIRTAKNRHLAGDSDAANALLERAEARARDVMDNEQNLFRIEVLDLLDRIRSSREEINNVVRLSPRVVVNLGAQTPSVVARGFVGVEDGEFIVYDDKDAYRVLLNTVDDPQHLSEGDSVLKGVFFSRYQTPVFLMASGDVVEFVSGQAQSMKTEDPAGWITSKDAEAYLRYLYILSPENNQVYKYERLGNRYAAPAPYNVNGELTDAIDMSIDSHVYILKKDGQVLKLFRGEVQPFSLRRAPEGILKGVTRLFKVFDGNFYFLDPADRRVVIVSDGGTSGEAQYLKQYLLEGEQLGEIKDIYVDPDEVHLYLLDEKRLYVVDLSSK